ncbi:methionine--tRNA ligase [Allostreptomyces psammosilenae]|uniref:Methionine--tRNA ligase n=1 Tax=Allostreptomyces psammosilenae TaxID=1892865 RepID=A0A853ABM0_9ACTN|nr:methionine--tRNA ligase [Allostreptomyces psammosilenae]NYI07878.1 methionyl-tRNA synthetase [Allostreptomyces psammosilenae]
MARYLITSALPYINGIKHLGNLVGSMLPADVYSRYLRLRGHEVLYICATDEHGTPAELAAKEAGLSVEEFCRRQHDLQAEVYRGFALSFDYFGRSSSAQNRELTQHFGRRLTENGLIEERSIQQVYSPADGRFLPDRYVIGTCPHCGYDRARGDQCENCTRLLDPTDLIEPRSAVSGSTELEVRETRHLYLRQSQLAERVRAWIETKQDSWPVLTTSIAMKWLNEGLEDRGITRDLDWGVPVEREGYEGKVYYVWFDAPIEYIGATKELSDSTGGEIDWRSWWRGEAAEDVTYVQFMAKDNIPFHSVMFPAMQMGTGEDWKLADYIKGFNWLNYYGGKFSTSQNYGIFLDQALELLPADYWRYFLMANAPESDDTSFTWELFAAQVNKDLADTLGNFVNRVLTFSRKRFGDQVPAGGQPGEVEARLGERVAAMLGDYSEALDGMQFRKAAQALRALWSEANGYLEQKAPWQEIKTDPEAAALTLRTAMNLIQLFAQVSEPIVPDTAARLRGVFPGLAGTEDGQRTWPTPERAAALDTVPAGADFTVPEVLFRKITDDDLAAWRDRFGAQ